jgi:hypothetical protein
MKRRPPNRKTFNEKNVHKLRVANHQYLVWDEGPQQPEVWLFSLAQLVPRATALSSIFPASLASLTTNTSVGSVKSP